MIQRPLTYIATVSRCGAVALLILATLLACALPGAAAAGSSGDAAPVRDGGLPPEMVRALTAEHIFHVGPQKDGRDPDVLVARIECVAFERGVIDTAWAAEPARWTAVKGILYARIEALEAFEAAFIRPHIDADAQAALIDTYWPQGVGPFHEGVHRFRTPEGVVEMPAMTPASRDRRAACAGFADTHALRAVVSRARTRAD